MINRQKFFDKYRDTFGSLTQDKVSAINFILDKLDQDEDINDARWYAYILATIKWETADSFEPITEKGSLSYLKGKDYYPFIGRGYVQLTWKYNYQKFGKAIGIDLVKNPTLANDHEIAWQILKTGMTTPVNFTGKTLQNYFNDNRTDWEGARKIINGTDKATTIGNLGKRFYEMIDFEE